MTIIFDIGLLTLAMLSAYIIIWMVHKAWIEYKEEVDNRKRARQNRMTFKPGRWY